MELDQSGGSKSPAAGSKAKHKSSRSYGERSKNLAPYKPWPSVQDPAGPWPVPLHSIAKRKRTEGPAGAVLVTGQQRFLEGLKSIFNLQLIDSPGNGKLRHIIIDGSNVAMSHGLGHFFSCRGIALAVQHFWDRGHKKISALVPQWRTKNDPYIKEQHYLMELKELGIVAFTPSREVDGKIISSYDDRLILQLAERTDGVVVSNDNFRDLYGESAEWNDIINNRLLQYTLVGDVFMVPDDPLGQGGPHLDQFLSTEFRSPECPPMFGAVSAPSPLARPPATILPRAPGSPPEPRQAWTGPGPGAMPGGDDI